MYVYIFVTGTGKSHVVQLIKRDMTYFLKNILNADPGQPIVLMTAHTGSAAYQVGESTIESALLIYDNFQQQAKLAEVQHYATEAAIYDSIFNR